ncbi:MAG: GTPase HflX [Clostridia bacterium]|nr:GTPase HflX [Clostridia bacterium]
MIKKQVSGNSNGLKKSMLELLESLYDIKSDREYYCHESIAQILIEVTLSTNREIAVFISQKGTVTDVYVGDFKRVSFSENIERGSRCLHTHPFSSGKLSSIDIDTLKNMSLSSMAAIGVNENGMDDFFCSYMNKDGNLVNTGPFHEIEETASLMRELYEFSTHKRHDHDSTEEKVIAVGVNTAENRSNLDELEQLILSAGGKCVFKLEQNRDSFDNAFYVGKGKMEEISYLISKYGADTVCFDDSLNSGQMRNLQESLNVKILDRSTLILDIFASRANSKEGKLQVELAQLNHLLPLLTGKGVELSRLGGGIGTRGPGESKLETDRRHILRRVTFLKGQLKEVEKRRNSLRESRKNNDMTMIALAGYTNAGKSTLLNKMTDSEVFVKDMLFATLDPSVRGLEISPSLKVLFVDTVGFISKLPHELIEAFKSTLEEVIQADLILHVIDGASKDQEQQINTVYGILEQLKADKIKVIEVFNKADLLDEIPKSSSKKVFLSAITGEGIPFLLDLIREFAGAKKVISVKVPYKNGKLISYIHDNCDILTEEFEESLTLFKLKATDKIINNIYQMLKDK